MNDFSYLKLPFAYVNQPIFRQPHWCLKDGFVSPMVRQPNYPAKKAFRTAGIVRGARPYALVVDDIQKDESMRHYDWNFTLESDIQIVRIDGPAKEGRQFDILLTGTDPRQTGVPPKEPLPAMADPAVPIPPGQPMLLVRVLNRNLAPGCTGEPMIAQIAPGAKSREQAVRRLIIPADAVSPDFKVLLYAFRQGGPLPKTAWNKAGTAVTVEIGGVKDTVAFASSRSGKTNVTVTRDGVAPVAVTRELEPLR